MGKKKGLFFKWQMIEAHDISYRNELFIISTSACSEEKTSVWLKVNFR